MTVRRVDQQYVDASGDQRVNALFVACARAHCRANAQTALRIFTGVRLTFGFLEVFNGDHAEQMEAVVHHQRFLDAFFVHSLQHDVTRLALFHRDQTFFRRHDCGNRLRQIGNEAHVAAGDDADQFVAFIHDRITGKAVALGQGFDFRQRRGRQDGLRFGYHAAFMFLHLANFIRLALNRHVFVDKAQTAFLRQRNSQSRFGYGIHSGGEHRDVQTNIFRQLSAEIGRVRQNGGVSRNEQNVVESKGFFSDS